jgi:uncharacterized iron-regulated membrane protein
MSPGVQRLWIRLHRWIALSAGWLLVLAAFLGALLTVAKPLDQWLHPGLFRQDAAAAGSPASLAMVKARLDAEFGASAGYTFRPPRQPGETLRVAVRGPWEGSVYFDATGRELGRRGETEGLYNLLFELHSSILLGDSGKAALTVAAGLYLVLLLSGLLLWWPRRWPPSFRIRWRAGALRTSMDLHNVAGALLGVLIAVAVASGAYMAWPALRAFVSSAGGQSPVVPPKLAPAPAAQAPAPLDALVQRAQALFPDAMVGYVIDPPGSAPQPVRVRLKLPDDPHPNGLTSVWLHPASGQVLKVVRWSELDRGSKAVSVVYPLHTGELGGPLHEVVVGISGLALSTLGVTGLLLWWKRRAVRARQGAVRAA